jgi:excisionase family DNA binding protein
MKAQTRSRYRKLGLYQKEVAKPQMFTSGQVARMLGIAPRTVSKECDKGRLKHHRVPGGEDRRIYADDLYRYCLKYELRVPPELAKAYAPELHPPRVVVLAGFPSDTITEWPHPWTVRWAPTLYEAGLRSVGADAAVFHHSLGNAETALAAAKAALRGLRSFVVPGDDGGPAWCHLAVVVLKPDAKPERIIEIVTREEEDA